MCSLKVLEPQGSPTQSLLQLLAERNCTLQDLQTKLLPLLPVQDTIRIVVQPESQVVAEGTCVSLRCQAAGPPGLTYQWFCGRQEVPGATAPELVMDTAARRGRSEWFICRVNCGDTFTFSQWDINCHVAPQLWTFWGYGLQILQHPQPCRLAEGDSLVLECRAIGTPPPQYQWFRNRRPLEGAQAPRFQVWQHPWHGTAWHGTAWHGTAWHSLARQHPALSPW
uniref:Ig-like domain-containing protein n=1 Tax=Amazona collaria TaxID=241587 RepID=A0A8B9J3F3_9PSIT